MTDAESLQRFRAQIAERLGLWFDDAKLPLLAEVLKTRCHATGLETEVYLNELEEISPEDAELAGELSVSETYFLRNPAHFKALARLLEDGSADRPTRLLSAGCCSGEEAYSMALIVSEAVARSPDRSFNILGIDADPVAIRRAREATYSAWSLRQTPTDVRERHFTTTGKAFRLNETLRRLVRFERRNLAQQDAIFWSPGAFDIIFCRNVLIYFTEEARRAAVQRMAEALAPGGYLFLGHAENLRGISNAFHLEHECDTFYYRRRDVLPRSPRIGPRAVSMRPEESPPVTDTSWMETIGSASARIEAIAARAPVELEHPVVEFAPIAHVSAAKPSIEPGPSSGLATSLNLLRRERYAEALESLAGEPDSGSPDAQLLRAVLLVQRGDPEAALETCHRLLDRDELNAGAHYVMALCREHFGELEAAREHDQTAGYLEPEFAMPHLHLGLMTRRQDDLPAARQALQRALGLLMREDATRILLFGGGFSREALIDLCQAELDRCREETS